MGLRFIILAAFYLLVMLYVYDQNSGFAADITGIFLVLTGLLILCAIALWPNASRADRFNRMVDGAHWADRIDMDRIAGTRPRSER
jgi:hypothetical protein